MTNKGANAERELVKMFLDIGWQSLRIAGSGQMDNAPDVLAGRPRQLFVIECKSTSKEQIYLKKEEVLNVLEFGAKLGAEPWYGFRFNYCEWKFIPAQELLQNTKIEKNQGIDFEKLVLKHKKTM